MPDGGNDRSDKSTLDFDINSFAKQHGITDSALLENFVRNIVKHELDELKNRINTVDNRLMRSIPWASLQFQLHLTHSCNLNCYACQHFSTLAKEEWFISLESVEKQLARLTELLPDASHGVHTIWLLGGEPLLHPDVAGIIEAVRKYYTFPELRLTTNGILLPKQDAAFWECVASNNVVLEVTPYPLAIDTKEIERKAAAYNVKLDGEGGYAYGDVERRKVMQSMKPMDIEGVHNPREVWVDCDMANRCIQLRDGKIYQCATAAYVTILNEYFGENFLLTERDFIDIYKVESAREIFDFLSKPIPFCRYCNHKQGMNFEWQPSKNHICEFADWEAKAERMLAKGDYTGARQLAEELLREGAFGHAKKWAFRILSKSYELQGNMQEAIASARKWLEAEPTRAVPRERLARLLRLAGDLAGAESLALDYLDSTTVRTGWAYRELFHVHMAKNDREKALAYGKLAIDAHPEHCEFARIYHNALA